MQQLLELAYSEDPAKQQKSAMDLAKLVDGAPFPAVSFGPLTHALCRLVPSQNRSVTSYAARALKMLLLDDALRPQAAMLVPAVVCKAVLYWEDEILCLRELLAALQTLCWDKACVKHVLPVPGILPALFDHAQSNDQEVSILALATLANIFVFVDTALLFSAEQGVIDDISRLVPVLVEIVKSTATSHRPQRFYATAALANVSAHPVFRGVLKGCGAMEQMHAIERQNFANLHILGSRISDCAQTAICRLTEGGRGPSGGVKGLSSDEYKRHGDMKYSFKWGAKPTMELSLATLTNMFSASSGGLRGFIGAVLDPNVSGDVNSNSTMAKLVGGCFTVWLCFVLFLFFPLFGQTGAGPAR